MASPPEHRCSLGSSSIGGPSLPRQPVNDFTLRYDEQDSDLDSYSSNPVKYSLALAGLRGSVSLGDRCYAWPFAKDLEREYEEDEREKGDDASAADSATNEGLLLDDGGCSVGGSFGLLSVFICMWHLQNNFCFAFFLHQNMKPVNSEYKAGCEFNLVEHIKEGSFGEVYRAQDVRTGFQFAAKKVTPLVLTSPNSASDIRANSLP